MDATQDCLSLQLKNAKEKLNKAEIAVKAAQIEVSGYLASGIYDEAESDRVFCNRDNAECHYYIVSLHTQRSEKRIMEYEQTKSLFSH